MRVRIAVEDEQQVFEMPGVPRVGDIIEFGHRTSSGAKMVTATRIVWTPESDDCDVVVISDEPRTPEPWFAFGQ